MSKYTFITDGGHGWLSVSLEEIQKLGITDQISSYSYITRRKKCTAPLKLDTKSPFFS
jgi:hypothetical protein